MRDYKDATDLVVKPVVIDRAAFNQGENAQYEPHIEQTDVMDSLVARGPHAVGLPIAMRESGQGYWMQDDKAGTLRAEGENRPSRPSHVIGQPHIVQASELRLKGCINPQDTCQTLLANTKSGDNDPLAVHAITFQPGNLRREAGADPSTVATTTLKASMGDQMPHICIPLKDPNDIACDEQRRQNGIGKQGDPAFTLRTAVTPGVATPMAVRRLTPVECERLQGFPDNWSQIPWKGKPADQCPDGPRYKCAGNSMAVPVMRWIGEQIARVELSTQQPK
jgi:DNA (cytosine-5)-methyltransferase 1